MFRESDETVTKAIGRHNDKDFWCERYRTLYNENATTSVSCMQCTVELPLEFLRLHIIDVHRKDLLDSCPCCYGNFCWDPVDGHSPKVLKHLFYCLKSFIGNNKSPPNNTIQQDFPPAGPSMSSSNTSVVKECVPPPNNDYWCGCFRTLLDSMREKSFVCSLCPVDDEITPMILIHNFESHLNTYHDIHLTPNDCIFCYGKWKNPSHNQHNPIACKHKFKCLKKFCRTQSKCNQQLRTLPNVNVADVVPCSECNVFFNNPPPPKDMAGRSKRLDWPEGFYEYSQPFYLYSKTHYDTNVVPFTDASGLGEIASPIFLQYAEGTHQWYHVVVRVAAWSAFQRIVCTLPGVSMLPYWCLCDGTRRKKKIQNMICQDSWIHHRHMVWVAEKDQSDAFIQALTSVHLLMTNPDIAVGRKNPITHTTMQTTPDYIRRKTLVQYKQIASERQLAHVLFSLSRSDSYCNGTVSNGGTVVGVVTSSSGRTTKYFINKVMSPHADLAMATLYREGLKNYVNEKLQKLKYTRKWSAPNKKKKKIVMAKGERKLRTLIQVKHIGIDDVRGCVLPFEKHVRPKHQIVLEGEYFSTLREATKIVTKFPTLWMYEEHTLMILETQSKDSAAMNDESWKIDQMKRGNCFLNVIDKSAHTVSNLSTKRYLSKRKSEEPEQKGKKTAVA